MRSFDSLLCMRGALGAALLAACCLFTAQSRAQEPGPDAAAAGADEEEEEAPEAGDAAAKKAEPAAPGGDAEPRVSNTPATEAKADGGAPLKKPLLSWSGGLELDIGYAAYQAEEESIIDDRFYDHRGRFVLGPLLHVDVGESFFFEATGQLVGWVKERGGSTYQINVDDAWGKFGQEGSWDVQVGRFEAWQVYNKFPLRDRDARPEVELNESAGAFDLFTLEDTGALCRPPISTGGYCVDMYEVNHILLREEVGSVAFHAFPHKTLKLELHGKYGEQNGQTNHLGGRLAVIFRPVDFLQLSAGAELRTQNQSSPVKLANPDGTFTERENGGRLDRRGAGGGLLVSAGPVEVALNAAIGLVDFWDQMGVTIADNSPQIVSYGGYGQVTLGPITVGGAANNTVRTAPSENLQTHLQTAGYVYYPFWDNLSLKLVGTYARGTDDPFILRDTRVPPTNDFVGARLRLKYVFTTL